MSDSLALSEGTVGEGMGEALLIFNPRAGRAPGVGTGALDRAQKILDRQRITTVLAPTEGPGSATELARGAVREKRPMVIVCGGDGTLNEVVNGLAGSDVPLALLPAGTANVMAKELNLPWNVERAAEEVVGSRLRRIALGLVVSPASQSPGRYFLSLAGAGPDGQLVRAVDSELKQRTRTLAYWAEGLRQLATYRFPRMCVTLQGLEADATLIVVGRTRNYGGPFQITTRADLFGADFELMLCTARSRWKYLSYLPMLWAGQLRRAREVHFLRATCVRCDPIDSGPIWLQVDGEPAGQLPAEFHIVPEALTLAVPARVGRILS
jgi:diacylglycerol kinase (ATP)